MEDDARAELIEAARKLFAGPIAFKLSVAEMAGLPSSGVPEVAFAGRSNVGKSSLLNALTGRHGLARASTTPGRTQLLNFFGVGDPPRLDLVDMPGYGFAEAPKDIVRRWQRLVGDYLRGRPNLRRVLLLIDSRHGVKPIDREIMEVLDTAAVSYQLVLTKADKLKTPALTAVTDAVAAEGRKHPAAHPDIIATSAEAGAGVPELRAAVLAAVE